MNNWRKKSIVAIGVLVCALVLLIFIGTLIDKKDIKKESTEVYETETKSESETESESEMESETEAESESQKSTETESQTEMESETEAESESQGPMESESQTVIESETEESSWIEDLDIAKQTTQIIVVAASGYKATVSMHTKNAEGVWKENLSVKGSIGKNGVGKEREGDKKTPIGVYRFTKAFGICSNPGISSMPYLQVDNTYHWVDDSKSKYYNQLVSTQDVEKDWTSSERIAKSAPAYNYILALNYNEDCTPGLGSAIFLHCFSGKYEYTTGCISISEENMIRVMQLLQSDCVIIIDKKENILQY